LFYLRSSASICGKIVFLRVSVVNPLPIPKMVLSVAFSFNIHAGFNASSHPVSKLHREVLIFGERTSFA